MKQCICIRKKSQELNTIHSLKAPGNKKQQDKWGMYEADGTRNGPGEDSLTNAEISSITL